MANILKIKNEQGEWIDIHAIKGDVGPQGPQGPQGPKGDTWEVQSYSDSASVADDKLTINYKVKQEDGTYSNVPVEFSGGSKYTFTDGLTETNGVVKFSYNNLFGTIESNNTTKLGADYYGLQIKNDGSTMLLESWDPGSIDYGGRIAVGNHGSSYAGLNFIYYNNKLNDEHCNIVPASNNDRARNNINLGSSSIKFKTLYCNNLSDGTTTKTMTDVLANSVAKYRHMIKLRFKIGELGTDNVFGEVNLDWINGVSTPYASLTDLINEIKSKVAANEEINCSGVWPEININNGKLSNIGYSNSIKWYTSDGTDKLFASVKDNSHSSEHEFLGGAREITVLGGDTVVAL